MKKNNISRRRFLATTSAATVALPLAGLGPGVQTARAAKPGLVRAVASANGLKAVERAVAGVLDGEESLSAAISGVNLVEDDPEDISVGYGGLPNEEGVVELDAAVMHGPSHKAGAVASLRGFKNPSKIARLVMEQTDHVLLVGEGAARFAAAHGYKPQELLTEHARQIWLYWKQTASPHDDWLPPDPAKVPEEIRSLVERITGTIHLGLIDGRGDLCCTTTTSGLFFKIPGRVGDSPIIGAGLYVDNAAGSAGSTGRGEANLQNLSSFLAVEEMRRGADPLDAGMSVLRRIAEHTHDPRLLDEAGRPSFNIKFYLLAKDGRYSGVSMWGPANYSVCDEHGPRHEEMEFLFERA